MKSFIKSLLITGLVSSAFFIASCGKTDSHDHTESDHAHEHKDDGDQEDAYACPMHPEETGNKGDKCSKCGMELELVDKKSSSNEYFMDFKAIPAVEAGKSAVLSFTPKMKGNENEVVPLDVQHDKKLHLIIVSKDLAYFDHVHPDYQASGSYDITVLPKGANYSKNVFTNETKFEQGGQYVLFADYLPSGSSNQVERIELEVAGAPYQPKTFKQEKTTATTDGYEVSLVPAGGKFLSDGMMRISVIVKKDGKEIAADLLENYLGAKAHAVMISEDTKDYLHVHPEVSEGRLDLHTEFGRPGIFRGWLQFQTEGKVHTADFVVKVKQGTAADGEHGGEDHNH
jgi:hypothetical protein